MIRSEAEYQHTLDKLRLMGALLPTVPADELEEFERRREFVMADVCQWILHDKPRPIRQCEDQPPGLFRNVKQDAYSWRQLSVERSLY